MVSASKCPWKRFPNEVREITMAGEYRVASDKFSSIIGMSDVSDSTSLCPWSFPFNENHQAETGFLL